MSKAGDMFFMNAGAVGICTAFLSELQTNGKISHRGNVKIDAFIDHINRLSLVCDAGEVGCNRIKCKGNYHK